MAGASSHRAGDMVGSLRLSEYIDMPPALTRDHKGCKAWIAACADCGTVWIMSSAQLSRMRSLTDACICEKRRKLSNAGALGGAATRQRVRDGSLPADHFKRIGSKNFAKGS